MAILGVLTVCSVAFGTKESSSTLRTKAEDNGGPLAAFKALAQNDQLLWVALSYLLYAIANVATTGVLMYLFKFILNNSAAYSIVGVVSVVAGIVMAPLYPILNKRIPRRYLYLGGMVLMVIGYLLFIINPTSLPVVTVGLVFFYLPQTFIQMTAILSLTDSIEYGQLKNGKRNEAVTLSVRPMLDKIAGACSNGIVGAVAIAAGMIGNATAADMTAANIRILPDLRLLCAARGHHPERGRVPAQGEDHREDARRYRQAARGSAERRLIRRRARSSSVDSWSACRLYFDCFAITKAAWWTPCGFSFLRSYGVLG